MIWKNVNKISIAMVKVTGGAASCSGVGAGEWHWCLKTATRRVARSRRSKKLHSQTLWAQTILAREQNWSVSE